MNATQTTLLKTLETLLPADQICPWDTIAPPLQSQITCAIAPTAASPVAIAYPQSIEELGQILACAARDRWRVLLCGSGSKLHWGGFASGIELVISTARMNRLIEHAVGDLTVTAEAGMPLADLQSTLATAGQFLPIDPAYGDRATLGGIVATSDTGSLRQRYGGIRDLLIGLSLVRADGQIAKAGGRVVKNVAGYDLMKLFTGSYGTLGAIAQVTLRIYPFPAASRTVLLTGEAEPLAQAQATLLASALTPTAIEILPPPTLVTLGMAPSFGLLSRFQNLEVSVEQQANQLLQVGQALGLQGQRFVDAALPEKAIATLTPILQQVPTLTTGWIHAGSGLGMLRMTEASVSTLLQLRQLCQFQGGFLTVLEAPTNIKQSFTTQTLDLWGYPGNALDVMKAIKQQFDPTGLLSPQRFVGGI
ncbi:MAG: FAD-binding oxidoreductase [Oculatellaceae cyanobacterium Prado106]|nr:FAD-binding oxidoreductase [Oculatellaceae cyanobacterium Prado106]